MTLYQQLKQYFWDVINSKEFVIAIDTTGVYIFKEVRKNRTTVEHAKKLLQILALEEEEAKLIFVLPESDCKYDSFAYEDSSVTPFILEVSRDDVEDLVRKLTGVRNIIFSKTDIDSIIDCFQDVTVELTPFQKQLCELGLTEEQAISFEAARPDSINDLIELGCPNDLVEEVYAAFREYYIKRNRDFEPLDTNNYVTIEKNMKRYRVSSIGMLILSIACWLCSLVWREYYFYISIVTCIFGVLTINMSSKSIKLKETVIGRICFVVALALLCIVIVPPTSKWIVQKTIELVQSIDFSITHDYFSDLHW